MFCSNCGFELKGNAKFCPNCGSKLKSRRVVQKNMYIAMFLSFILTGLGVIYAGNSDKGLRVLAAVIIFSVLGLFNSIFTFLAAFFWIYGLYATYMEVKLANGENPDLINDYKSLDKSKKNLLFIFILLIVLVLAFISISSLHLITYHPSDSSDYRASYSSGGSHSSHYGGVDTMPGSIVRDDPDWYYDHYEYGDDFDIDEYLESEGYD